jgi:hypothetical protein
MGLPLQRRRAGPIWGIVGSCGRSMWIPQSGVTALASPARAQLVELGFRKAVLWVLVGNARAERFYQADGWVSGGVSRTDSVWGLTVNEVLYKRGLEAPSPVHAPTR